MSSLRHPVPDQLLRFADGELDAAEAGGVRAHLSACWQCRTELEEIERTIRECVRYREKVMEACEPAEPWFDIYPRLALIDESQKRRPLAARTLDSLKAAFSTPRRWIPAAVIPLLIAILVHEFRQTPSVRAAELLHKAMAAAESRASAPRRIRIRTRTRQLTRIVGILRSAAKADAGDDFAGLESLFRAAHYSWADPLSAKSYAEWRDQLADKRDEVVSGQDGYRLRTVAGSGELLEATLRLDSRDLHAVEGTLQFRNREWVEISELPGVPNIPTEKAEAPPLRVHPSREASVSAPDATPGEELQVVAGLHRLGADLGDPIAVARYGGKILVTGAGISPGRQQEIRDALSAMPRVTIRFSAASSEVPSFEMRGPRAISVGPGASRWQAELEEQLGGRAAFEQFADQILERTDGFMSRAHALHRLAGRFPVNVEAQMSSGQRDLLRTLRSEHAAALLRNVTDIQNRLQPVLAALGAASSAEPASVSGSWQDETEQLFTEARHAETMLIDILGATDAQSQSAELPAQVSRSLTQLTERARNYERPKPGR